MTLSIALSWGYDIWNDRQAVVEILETTAAYKEWDIHSPGKIKFTIEPTDKIKVLRIRYGKDFMAAKIRKNDQAEGWIRHDKNTAIVYWRNET